MNSHSPWTEALPRRTEIDEQQFARELEKKATGFLQEGASLLVCTPQEWTLHQVYKVYQDATEVETFLDDFGARENRAFFPIRELVAMVRWLTLAMSSTIHLDTRLLTYQFADTHWAKSTLAPEVRNCALELAERTQACLDALRRQWIDAGMRWPDAEPGQAAPPSVGGHPRLKRNLIEDREFQLDVPSQNGGTEAGRLANRFLQFAKDLEGLAPAKQRSLDELREFLATRFTEEKARSFEARVHNLQSSYDSQLSRTPQEAELPELKQFRGAVSTALHLCEALTALVHLYERHDVYGRHGTTKEMFERLISEEKLFTIAVNNLLANVYEVVSRTVPTAKKLLKAFTKEVSLDLEIPKGITLHARPISMIVSIVNHHSTPVTIQIGDQECSAASIMQMLVLAGSSPQSREVRFKGDQKALEDLQLLFQNRLGEDGLDDFPEQLRYLRSG